MQKYYLFSTVAFFFRYLLTAVLLLWFMLMSGDVLASVKQSSVVRISVAKSFSETGLLQALIEKFQINNPHIQFEIHAFGSLAALEYVRNSDVDLVISHYPIEEKRLLLEGLLSKRTQIMFSKYAVFGPPDDEHGFSQKKNIVEVLRTIADEELPFLVPSPQGGTYAKVEELWALASINPGWPDYQYTNLSTSAALKQAAIFQSYVISEMGVFFSNKEMLAEKIIPLYQNDVALQNIYSVSVANQENNKVKGHEKHALLFYQYLISEEGQESIRQIGKELFNALFAIPAADLDPELIALRKEEQTNNTIKLLVLVIFALIMLLTATIFLIHGYKKNQKLEKEHNRLQKEVQHSQKMEAIGLLTSGVAHDFNNVLAAILGFSSLAYNKTKQTDDEKLARYLKQINKAGNRGKELVEQLLVFSRKDTSIDKAINVAPLIKNELKMLRSILPSSIEIKTEIDEDVPPILLTTIKLQQCILNLAINARDAMHEVGALTIKLQFRKDIDAECVASHKTVAGDWVALSVSDTGDGIETNKIKDIFTPFFTSKEMGKGTGLGLSVVYGILRHQDGHILLDTEVGKGSTFTLLFKPG